MQLKQEYLSDFIKTLKFQEFKSANTLSSYKKDLETMYAFFEEQNLDFNKVTLIKYMNYLVAEKFISINSQARAISSIKKFCLYLLQQGYTAENHSSDLETPKKEKSLPKAINNDVLKQIIHDNSVNETEQMAKAILIIFYATGLRISELLSLRLSDLEENNAAVLKVKGKGNKQRLVPLGNIATEVLTNHINNLKHNKRYENANLSFVFPSLKKSKDGSYGAISRQYVYAIIHKLGLKYGVDLSPHKLRHSFATELVKNQADLRTIQVMLGHSDLATTQIYTKIADEQAYNALLNNHPLAKK